MKQQGRICGTVSTRDQQREPVALRLARRQQECAALLREITPGEVASYAIPGFLHGSSIARQRNGDSSNKLFAPVVLLEAMAQAGRTRQEMMAIVAHLLGVIEELRPAKQIDLREALLHAQASDSTEDVEETRALLNDGRALDRIIQAKELNVADELTAIAALRHQRHWHSQPAAGWARSA